MKLIIKIVVLALLMFVLIKVANLVKNSGVYPGEVWVYEPSDPFRTYLWQTNLVLEVRDGYVSYECHWNGGLISKCSMRTRLFKVGATRVK